METPTEDEYENLIETLEAHISQLTEKPIEETMAGLSEFERAKFTNTLAYAYTTIQLCYLRTRGDSDMHHNVKYLPKMKQTFAKIDKYIDYSVG